MDRFSLLLLEPGEIYFDDFAVTLHRNPDFNTPAPPTRTTSTTVPPPPLKKLSSSSGSVNSAPRRTRSRSSGCGGPAAVRGRCSYLEGDAPGEPVPGRLKICSKSLVFVPAPGDLQRPLLKFALSECQQIEEWLPKSFQSRLAKEKSMLVVTCSNCVEMMSRNVLAPFRFVRHAVSFVFSLTYVGGGGGGDGVDGKGGGGRGVMGNRLEDYLAQIGQLQRASTLPPVEQSGMIAAIVYSRQCRLEFEACWLDSVQENILLRTVGNKITPLVVNPGRIVLTDVILYFQPYNNAESNPVIKVKLSSIKRIFQRRYLLRPLGLEIDYVNHKGRSDHIYLTFNKPEERQKLYHKMIQQKSLQLEDIREDNMTLLWQNGLISNFDYLIYLNSAADRSFNDLTQYPVFPWVVADYHSNKLDLTSPLTFRDLHRPMGALDPERLAGLKERTQDMPEPRFLYGSHYSTPGFVLYFLVRKIPECMLCLQNGRFDHPDRMFNSIPQTWVNVTTHTSDFKELVPEFYMPENEGDFLQNLKEIDFGTRHCGTPVADVGLPPWAENPTDFVKKLREALESDYVSANLHGWIDLIFGYKQRGKEAEKANNLFYHLCYEGSVDLEGIRNLEDRYALEVQIGEFGQVPKQLFNSPHPQRRSPASLNLPAEMTTEKLMTRNGSTSSTSSSSVVVVESDVNQAKRWPSMELMRRVCDYKAHKESLSAVAISVDNFWVFSASHDSILKMYSLEEMQVMRSITVPNMTLSCCLPLPNNKTVLLGSKDNNLCSYSIEFGRTSDYLAIHRDAVSCMDWHGDLLATGSWDSTVKVWHCSKANGFKVRLDGDLLAQLEHQSQVTCLHIGPDNSQLASGTRDGSVVLWCLKTNHTIQELPAHRRQVKAVKFSPDGSSVVSCGSDFYLKVIDLKTGSILFSKDLGEELNCLSWDGRTALLGGGSGSLSLWDLRRGVHLLRVDNAHSGPVTVLTVSEGGEFIVTGGEDRRVVVWTTKDNKEF